MGVLDKLRTIHDTSLELIKALEASLKKVKQEESRPTEKAAAATVEAEISEDEAEISEESAETSVEGEDAHEEKVAVAEESMAKPRRGRSGGVNRSEIIREYCSKNKEARNVDIIEYLKKEHKISVTAALVSSVRKTMHPEPKTSHVKAGKARVGRPPNSGKAGKAVKVGKVGKARVGRPSKIDLPMPAHVVRVLQGASREGLKLAEMAELIKKAGYKYAGAKGRQGFIQNVYQAVHNLSIAKTHAGYVGETPVVIHDGDSKRYRLNPKAKKKNAAA